MYSFSISFACALVLQLRYIVAEPMITPAPLSPIRENLVKQRMLLDIQAGLRKRASTSSSDVVDNLQYCYSDDSVCVFSNDLFADCQVYENQVDLSQWYQCICGNGYVSAEQA